MKKILMSVMILGLAAAAAPAAQASTFDRVLEHYEPIRLALLGDSLDGVAGHGRAIAAELESLAADSIHARLAANSPAELGGFIGTLLRDDRRHLEVVEGLRERARASSAA